MTTNYDLDEIRRRNKPTSIEALLLSMNLTDPIKEGDLEEIDRRQKEYAVIDGIPEHLWKYAKTYHALTGQTPNMATRHDWINEMEIWYQEKLDEQSIKLAFEYLSGKGIPIGRPGTLTNSARGMKTGQKNQPAVNRDAIQRTLKEQEQKFSGNYVPRPDGLEKPKNLGTSKPQKPLYKKGQDPECQP